VTCDGLECSIRLPGIPNQLFKIVVSAMIDSPPFLGTAAGGYHFGDFLFSIFRLLSLYKLRDPLFSVIKPFSILYRFIG
jgi:hypothetical protein